MIGLRELARLAAEHADDLDHPVAPWRVGGADFDTDTRPMVMGVVNLSRDSTYRESVATSAASAVRRAVVMAAQGADVVDVGAESTSDGTERVDPASQVTSLVPVVEQAVAAGVRVSVEGYDTDVVEAGLRAGACLVNLTGSDRDEEMFALAAAHDAAVVLCHIGGDHARAVERPVSADPVPDMLEQFGRRLARARELGVEQLAIDPGVGFAFGGLDRRARVRHQAMVLVQSFRLRRLGVPVCQALPHAFELFESEFRTAEGFFAVLAHLGGAGLYRVHEVARVVAVLETLAALDDPPG